MRSCRERRLTKTSLLSRSPYDPSILSSEFSRNSLQRVQPRLSHVSPCGGSPTRRGASEMRRTGPHQEPPEPSFWLAQPPRYTGAVAR